MRGHMQMASEEVVQLRHMRWREFLKYRKERNIIFDRELDLKSAVSPGVNKAWADSLMKSAWKLFPIIKTDLLRLTSPPLKSGHFHLNARPVARAATCHWTILTIGKEKNKQINKMWSRGLSTFSKPSINIFPHANVCYETHVSFLHSLTHSYRSKRLPSRVSVKSRLASVAFCPRSGEKGQEEWH